MTIVEFSVELNFPVSADRLFAALVDWRSHQDWIPATTVRVLEGDGGIGTRFVARSGVGPLAFDDTMTVTVLDAETRRAEVVKTGPLLGGGAGFSVDATASGARLHWHEAVEVPHLPRPLAPVAAWVGGLLFRTALRRLEHHLRR